MIDKKQNGGLEDDNADLIQPSGDQSLNANNLINTVENNKPLEISGIGGVDILRSLQNDGFDPAGASTGQIRGGEFDTYERLIDGPFSLTDNSLDDKRAEGQGFGEKAANATLKFFPKTASHVLGSTYGLLDGFAEVAKDAYNNGMGASNWNKFFNNDFQRSLDDFNKSVDEKLPHYYTSQEADLNFTQSVFGKGAANFWTNDFSQGLSFVAGAVISEVATGGAARWAIPAKAANHLKRVSALRNTAYTQKSTAAASMLNKISKADRIYDGLTTGRRLLTGAFYEAGVEARHNYDSVLDKLNTVHAERGEGAPTEEQQAKMKDIAIKVSNGVFAGNAALVGYSNILMFPKLFRSGLMKNKKFKNKITQNKDGTYKAKHKDFGRMRNFVDNKYTSVLGKMAYEGVVEEGGQKTLDIAGQYAAEDMYLNQRSPGQMQAVGEIMNHTFDGMAKTFTSTEGQKEMFLGAVLAGLGLPSFTHTNKETGEKKFKIGYGTSGGFLDFMGQYAEGRQEVEDVVDYMNNNPDAMAGIRNNFEMLVGMKNAEDQRDYADATNNDFAYKNADHDQFFSFVHSRLQGGYFGDVIDSLEDMRGMDLDTFETMFNYEEQTQEMSKQDREAFLSERRNTVIDTHIDRAKKIQQIHDSLDNTKIDPRSKRTIAQALSSTADLDSREQKLISELEDQGGFALTAIVNREENDKESNEGILSKVKSFVMDKLGMKAKNVMENSEVGREIKREIGIKRFTEPGHPRLVFERMMTKLQSLKKQMDAYEQNDELDKYVEVGDKVEKLEVELGILAEAINARTAVDISSEEQQVLDEYKKRDPAGYELNKDEMIKKLQDLRRIRAKRHQMLNLVQQLLDPAAAKDKIQRFEEQVNDILTEEERKSLPPEEQRLGRKYKGKTIEFQYTDKNGNVRTHRVYVKDSDNLVKLPSQETFRLLQRRKALLEKTDRTQDEAAELELINEELEKAEHVTKFDSSLTIGVLKKATNIKVLEENSLILEQLQTVTSILQDQLAEKLSEAVKGIEESKQELIDLALQIKDIKTAISQAKQNKNGDLRVNLNSIGKGSQNKVSTAFQLMQDLKVKEDGYNSLLTQFTSDLATLNENSLRMQVIYTSLTNPETVSNILGTSNSKQDVYNAVTDLLGLTSMEEFYQNLGEKGFFDINELTSIAGQKNKDGGYDVDSELLQEILNLTKDNISAEYLDLMNTDLEHFRKELELLKIHRQDVERMLSRMVDPKGQAIMFPPEGLTPKDLEYLSRELRMVDNDIQTLQGIVNMMEAETEQNLLDGANNDLIQDRLKAIKVERDMSDVLIEYQSFLSSISSPPAEQADLENGESLNDTEQDLETESMRENSPDLSTVGWNKTAGNHGAAMVKYRETYKTLIDKGDKLTEAEQMELQHVESQLRFFRKSYEIFDYSKKTGAKLQIVTRYNIPQSLKDKIVFYDIAKARKSGRFDDPSNYKYADDLTENINKDETLESIKLLLVDANGEPILIDGEITYTDMNSSDINNSRGIFKGKENDKDENGNLLPTLQAEQEAFIAERNLILNDNKVRFFQITRKSRGIPQKTEEGLQPSIGRLEIKKGRGNKGVRIAKEDDLKDMPLTIALPAKGTKGADKFKEMFGFQVRSRFTYFGTPTRGHMGTNNLITAYISALSENQVNNIYNLSRYFAENDKDGINLGGKGFNTILKEQIIYGDRSKERERQEFSIYMQEDAIFFGDKGKSISLEQLKDTEKNSVIHEEYKGFLRTLYFNVLAPALKVDQDARIKAVKEGNKVGTFKKPEYTTFSEVIVNDDLSTEVKEWDNYTHYLLSAEGRENSDVPLKVNLPLATDPKVDQRFTPQYLNVYFEHESQSFTNEGLENDKKDSNRTIDRTNNTVVDTNTKEDVYEERVVINSETGERRTIVVKIATEEEKVLIEADINKVDEMEDSPFTRSDQEDQKDTESDEPFFLANMEQPSTNIDLNSEIEWFNANMPKDSKGNELVSIEMIKGLIDGKGFGKFTKDGNILLSELLNTPGIIYHESWHAVTRRFIPSEERFAMYDEVRGMRGSTQTFKGETKKMSTLTDKEADEWLAEEFREYAMNEGAYKVGDRIEKSFIDKIFDKIFNLLDFFINNKSQAQELMSKLNTGYFSNPTTDITIYGKKGEYKEAYFDGKKLTATMRNNAMEGMTVLLFTKALKSGVFELSDFVDPEKTEEINAAVSSLYGSSKENGTVYSQMIFQIEQARDRSTNPKDIQNLNSTIEAIRDNWEQLKSEHSEYLKRFKIDITSESEELEKTREQFGKPQNEIDPSVYLPKTIRLLLSTLPLTTKNKKGFVLNESGLPKLVDFGSIMNFMYKEFANINPLDFRKTLIRLESKRSEIKLIKNRLGLQSDDLSSKTSNQMRLIVQAMMQFDQSNNTFYTQLITREGGRRLINSNQNRVEDKIKLLWTNNFKENIQGNSALGKDVNGELILNKEAKIKVGNKTKTFNNWAKDPRRTADETLIVLDQLGITFTKPEMFADLYEAEEEIKQAVNYIFESVYNQPVSNIFKGDIQANLRTLVELEALTNPTTIDLQHRSPDGKTIHGVNLKTYADVLVSELSTVGPTGDRIVNVKAVQNLLGYDNLKGSHYLKSMLENRGTPLEVVVLQGIEQSFGTGKSLSKGSPVDIGVMMINSLLTEGIAPILRTADKKTEFGLKFAVPTLKLGRSEMIQRLQGYLADELRVASRFNSKRKSKLHKVATLKDKGGSLRFFNGVVPSIERSTYNRSLSEIDIQTIIENESTISDLNEFLDAQVQQTLETLQSYNISNGGIDSNLIERAIKVGEVFTDSNEVGFDGRHMERIAEQFTYEYMTSVNEQGKLLLGDFALYSDLFKRTSGISGTKSYPTSDDTVIEWMNSNMPNLLSNKEHGKNLRVSHRAAVKTEAPYLEQYMATLDVMGMTAEFMNNVNDVYSDMEEFDGGGFITLDAYRSLLYRTGKWTPTQEKFYQKIVNNEYFESEDMAIFGPIKPQLFGPFIADNSRLMTFHKFALFPLVPRLMENKAFDSIHQDMINNNIDYMIFESAVKVGGVTAGQEYIDKNDNPNGYDPFYEELPTGYSAYKTMELDDQSEPLGLQELNFSDLGIQVEMAPGIKYEVTEGSQLRSLLPINVYDQGKVSEGYGEFESLIDKYHEINTVLLEKDFNSLIKKLKLVKNKDGGYTLDSENLQVFKDVLIEEFKKRDNPLHTIDAIKQLLDSDTKFIEQLFEKNKIESLLYSLVNNNVVKRKMPGGQFVLQASTGFENDIKAIKQKDFELANKDNLDLHLSQLKPLKFYRKLDPNNFASETLAMQVYLPSRFRDKMGDIIEDVNSFNIDPEILQLIGFRIPTEGLNSMDFIEVVGFLPKSFGDTVIVPSEIVGKAGSDYDIDKLSIYFPNVYMEGDVVTRVKFDDNKTVKQQSKKALQNEVQSIMRDILSHPKSFDQLITPVGASTLKDEAKVIAMKRNPNAFDLKGNKIPLSLSQTLKLESMINTSYRMFSGLGGIGIVATSSTQHSKGQRPGVNWNFANHENIIFNFAGEGFGLSRVYDVAGKDKISSTIGQYVTGYVDVTKEDFVFDINAGIDMAPVHMALIRSGVPLKTVINFMSQPIIDDYVKLKELNQPMYATRALKSDDKIIEELIIKYKKQSSKNVKFTLESLQDMVGKNTTELSTMENRMQVQILNDFLVYKNLAEDLLLLKDATSVDTSNLNSSIAVRYAKQSINRLETDGRFTNLDELLYGNEEGSSTVGSYNTLLNEVDGMFSEFKLGEYLFEAKEFIDTKIFESTDKESNAFKDSTIYKMKRFENFLSSTVVQNTAYNYEKLSEKGRGLFIGENSLPRRINSLKKISNNLLIQELTPILQVYTEESQEGTVDGLRLFSKGLQAYDIDLLSDAFFELKETNPNIAEDLIIFSALQSGYDYSPSSFFQVLPGTEVLSVLSKYFKQNKTKDRRSGLINKSTMESLWTDFHKNNSNDKKVTPNIYRKSVKNSISLNRNDDFITISTKTGEETIGSKIVSVYETELFKKNGHQDTKGLNVYTKINKKGVPFSFIEATGSDTPSIVNRNGAEISQDNNRQEYNKAELPTNPTLEVIDVIKDKKC